MFLTFHTVYFRISSAENLNYFIVKWFWSFICHMCDYTHSEMCFCACIQLQIKISVKLSTE